MKAGCTKKTKLFHCSYSELVLAVFMLETHNSSGTNLGKHFFLRLLTSSSIKTVARRNMRLDELSSLVRLRRRTLVDSSSRRVMHLVIVFILEDVNESRKNVFPS